MRRCVSCTAIAIWNGALFIPSCAAWFAATKSTNSPVSKPPSQVRLLILPGFGNNDADYLKPGSLVDSLQKRGWSVMEDHETNMDEDDASDADRSSDNRVSSTQIRVLPIQRTDWLQVFFRGALDVQFWQNTADPTRPAFRWYLDCIAAEIQQLTQCESDDDKPVVILVGHSAGGWLGRAALGYYGTNGSTEPISTTSEIAATGSSNSSSISNSTPRKSFDLGQIVGLVTLGAPHFPPPPDRMDMTRGALRLTHETFPGIFHNEQLFYLTVVGDAVQGVEQQKSSPLERTTVQGFAYNSYDAVCGIGNEIGDGVVPVCSAHLPGAVQINLPGIYHSINVPDQWYGSDSVIDQWHTEMLAQIKNRILARDTSLKR